MRKGGTRRVGWSETVVGAGELQAVCSDRGFQSAGVSVRGMAGGAFGAFTCRQRGALEPSWGQQEGQCFEWV